MYVCLCAYMFNNNIIRISQHGYVNRCGGAYLDGVCGLRDETRENEEESKLVEITANTYINAPAVEITETIGNLSQHDYYYANRNVR